MDLGQYNLIGAGVSAGGGIISSIAGAISAKNSQKRQYQYNTMLQQQAAELEQNNWLQQYERMFKDQLAWRDDERAYNTPSAQMARLKDAGINPTFGNGGINSGNYSLNPEMPGTAASIGSSGVGAPVPLFGNAFGDAAQYALEDRRVRALEKEVGIKSKLSDAEFAQMSAKTKEILSQKDLNDEQKKQVSENINLIRSQVVETGNRAQAILVNSLLDQIKVNQQQQYNEWLHDYYENQSAIGFIEANAAAGQAMTARGQLEFQKDKWRDELKLRGQELDNESERLLQSFEKQGVDALFKAIDEASSSFGSSLLGFTGKAINEQKLIRIIGTISAGTRYFQDLPDNSLLNPKVIDALNRFNELQKKVDMFNRTHQLPFDYFPTPYPPLYQGLPSSNPKIGE